MHAVKFQLSPELTPEDREKAFKYCCRAFEKDHLLDGGKTITCFVGTEEEARDVRYWPARKG